MRYLLDTNVWLWLQTAPERVSKETFARLADHEATVLLSAVSSWEIAIKWSLGRLPLPEPPGTYIPSRMSHDAVDALPISHVHTLHVATLPQLHRDPFDRLLIAQAQIENIPLVTADSLLTRYDVDILPA